MEPGSGGPDRTLGGLFYQPVQAQFALGLWILVLGVAILNAQNLFDVFATSTAALGIGALRAVRSNENLQPLVSQTQP